MCCFFNYLKYILTFLGIEQRVKSFNVALEIPWRQGPGQDCFYLFTRAALVLDSMTEKDFTRLKRSKVVLHSN